MQCKEKSDQVCSDKYKVTMELIWDDNGGISSETNKFFQEEGKILDIGEKFMHSKKKAGFKLSNEKPR